MTVPPEGPYGQTPYSSDPRWGAQPQGGYPGGYGQPAAPGSGYPSGTGYPPGQPYSPFPGQPYAGGPYPGQPQPPAPPEPPRSKLPWVIGVTVLVVVAAIATVVVVAFNRHGDDSSTTASSATSTAGAPSTPSSTQPQQDSEQTATDCTENAGSAGTAPTENATAGQLSFPISAATDWPLTVADDQLPNAIDAVGVLRPVPDTKWMMQAEVAISNLVADMSVADQASKLLTCIAQGPGYAQSSPVLGEVKSSEITVDGTKAARVDADITVAPDNGVPGDSVVVIAVDTKPVTFFFACTPIGDTANRDIVEQIIAALKVTSG